MRRPAARLALAAALAVAMGAYCATHLRVTTDITHFLPAGADHRLGTLSHQLADSALTRTLILSVEGPDGDAARTAARALGERLAAHPEVDFVRPCNLCPHMKRITLAKIRRSLETMTQEVTIDPAIAARARRSVERMLAVGRR